MQVIERAIAISRNGIVLALAASGIPEAHRKATLYYLLVTGTNCDGGIVGRVMGCTRANVNKALHKVEDLRDDPAFDAALTELETQLFGE